MCPVGPVTMRNSAAVSAQLAHATQAGQSGSKQIVNASAIKSTSSAANMEEVASMFSSKMQEKKSNREKNTALGSHLQRRINSIHQINALSTILDMESAVDKKSEDILSLTKSGGHLQGWCDDESEKGVEPAEIFLSLKNALLNASGKDKPEIERAIQNLVRENGTSIQTSFNVATTVAKAYPDQEVARTMRKAIGEGNQQNYDTRSIMDLLLKHFGEDDFGRSLDTYARSISSDLESFLASTDPDYLKEMVNNIHASNGARSLVNDCDDLLLDFKKLELEKPEFEKPKNLKVQSLKI